MSVPVFHGSRGGGGPTPVPTDRLAMGMVIKDTAPQATDMAIRDMGTLIMGTPTRLIRSTPIQDISRQTKGG